MKERNEELDFEIKEVYKPKKSRNKLIMASVVVMLVVSISLVSYALWQNYFQQTDSNTLNAGCFEMNFTESTSAINLNNTYPMSDERGLREDPYTFKLKNTCTLDSEYYITLDIYEETTIDLSKIKVNLSGDKEVSPVLLSTLQEKPLTSEDTGIIVSKIITQDGLSANKQEEKEYSLKLWIDEAAGLEIKGQELKARLTIHAVAKASVTYLTDAILDSYGGANAIQELPMTAFESIANSEATSGLFKMTDDYGDSYYFRGHRDYVNNNVIFAGFQWKIIRINGDGSIRMIYNGTEAQYMANGNTVNAESGNTKIEQSAYNLLNADNTYVGYKYGTAGASTYEEAHSNTTDSAIKIVVDTWYANNIANQGLNITSKIVDRTFCNDREEYGTEYEASGYASYEAVYRIHSSTPNPKFICTQENDQYTVASGRLTYPVGLITADEVVTAGGSSFGNSNNKFYLYSGQEYWTMTPSHFDTIRTVALMFTMYYSGRLANNLVDGVGDSFVGARPVINLSSEITIASGDGSATNPYRIF